jgi:hypothetical protein
MHRQASREVSLALSSEAHLAHKWGAGREEEENVLLLRGRGGGGGVGGGEELLRRAEGLEALAACGGVLLTHPELYPVPATGGQQLLAGLGFRRFLLL